MNTYQVTRTTVPLEHAVDTFSVAWARISRKLKERLAARRQKRAISRLSAHLRHDVGELDCRPLQTQALQQAPHMRQQTLETMWLDTF